MRQGFGGRGAATEAGVPAEGAEADSGTRSSPAPKGRRPIYPS